MGSTTFLYILLAIAIIIVDCNSEGEALYDWKKQLVDPNNVLQTWDLTQANSCTWFHITCNADNSVVKVDLENTGLSGTLVPKLGNLANLQYLELANNNLSGIIPPEIGNLKKLISLDLDHNKLTGSIPSSLSSLHFLKNLRLNSNKLSGSIPMDIIKLAITGNLRILNVSDNLLTGTIHNTGPEGLVTTTIFQDPKAFTNSAALKTDENVFAWITSLCIAAALSFISKLA